jgi:hypothetical protein
MDISELEKLQLKQLQKNIPSYKEFNKKIELNLLKNWDDINNAFEYVRPYSKDYYQIREFLKNQLFQVFTQYYHFSKSRKRKLQNYINYKNYLQNEIEPIEEDIEGISEGSYDGSIE